MKIYTVVDDKGVLQNVFSTTGNGAKQAFVMKYWVGLVDLPLAVIASIWNKHYKEGFRIREYELFESDPQEAIPQEAYDVLAKSARILDSSKDITPDPNSL